jgi:predicted transcriptional regulator
MKSDISLAKQFAPFVLGPLESEVMLVVSELEDASVRDVLDNLSRPLAYTTVMTTLDRLYRKSLLERRKFGRGFLYKVGQYLPSAHLRTIERRSSTAANLISSLVEAVSSYDENTLNELEKKIAERRRQLPQKNRS